MNCTHCRTTLATGTCCAVASYCSTRCQSRDWVEHAQICKRGRESDSPGESDSRKQQNLRGGDEPTATAQTILGNPQRMRILAHQYTREKLIEISRETGNDFYGRLNRENMFWYFVSSRFMVNFNPLIDYKQIAGRLL